MLIHQWVQDLLLSVEMCLLSSKTADPDSWTVLESEFDWIASSGPALTKCLKSRWRYSVAVSFSKVWRLSHKYRHLKLSGRGSFHPHLIASPPTLPSRGFSICTSWPSYEAPLSIHKFIFWVRNKQVKKLLHVWYFNLCCLSWKHSSGHPCFCHYLQKD